MFNDWLLERMKELDWSQADLARASGLTRPAISNYINGRTPDEAALVKIAKALKLPRELVFEKAGLLLPKTDDTPIERTILALVKSLPENEQATFLAMLETWQEKRAPAHKNAK